MDHAPSSPCGLYPTAPRNIVRASAAASTNKAVKYHGTAGPSSQAISVPAFLASIPSANAITTAAPVTHASTVTLGPTSASVKKYKHDRMPAPIPMPSEKSQTLCSDQRMGCGNIQRTRPNPASHIAARHNSNITVSRPGKGPGRCPPAGVRSDDSPAKASYPFACCDNSGSPDSRAGMA